VYGLDIETDTSDDGTDPQVACVRTVALSSEGCDEVFSGDEADLLAELDERLAALPPGVLATWNGAAFDLPFLADRAAVCGVAIGLRLRHDARIGLRRAPLPGHPGAYRASWYGHHHLDAYRLYRGDVPASPLVPGGLRSLVRLVGLRVVEVDRDHVRELEREVRHAYAPGDARLARVLTERRWPAARSYIDRRVPDRGPWVPPWLVVEPEPQVEVEVEVLVGAGVGGGGGWSSMPVDFDGAVRVVEADHWDDDAGPDAVDAPDLVESTAEADRGDEDAAPAAAADDPHAPELVLTAHADAAPVDDPHLVEADAVVDVTVHADAADTSPLPADPVEAAADVDRTAQADAAAAPDALHVAAEPIETATQVDLTVQTAAAAANDAPDAPDLVAEARDADADAVVDLTAHADDAADAADDAPDAPHLVAEPVEPDPVVDLTAHADATEDATPDAPHVVADLTAHADATEDAAPDAPHVVADLTAHADATEDDARDAPHRVAEPVEATTEANAVVDLAVHAEAGPDAASTSGPETPSPSLFDQEAPDPDLDAPQTEVA
jgi:hypothetical protein